MTMIKQIVMLTYKTQFDKLSQARVHEHTIENPDEKDFQTIFDWVNDDEDQTLHTILQDGELEQIKTIYIEEKCKLCGK